MTDIHFVRTEMLAPQQPPKSEGTAVSWMRDNLFFSIGGSIATLVTVGVLVWLAILFVNWALLPSWGAQSLSDCRSIIAELGRDGHNNGACWGVIRDRGMQLLFGFYPRDLLWRPILAFLLLAPTLAPILFVDRVPRWMIMITALYPFAMPFLLWGGSVWLPFCVLVGFAVGYGAFRAAQGLSPIAQIAISALAAILWWGLAAAPLASTVTSVFGIGLTEVSSRSFGGFLLSMTIGVVAIGFSLPIGVVLALGRQSHLMIVKTLSVGFIELIRGVPLITLLFVASTLLNIFMPPGTDFDIIMRVIIMATLFASAYMAEVIRGGLAALPTGQYEAADSLGLDYWKAQRLIVLPQALKISIPGIVSTFIALFKDTTLVSVIGLLDPLGLTVSIRANPEWTGVVWELYGFIALLFFIATYSMSRYSMYLERKLHRGH